MQDQAGRALNLAITSLTKLGVRDECISTDILLAGGKTISQAILEVQEKTGCNTLVVGKRGVSKNEEFLFGSISNTLAQKTKGFTTWIVG